MADAGSGDLGMTHLGSGELVPKSHPRIQACGEVDELASVLGALAAALAPDALSHDAAGLRRQLKDIQADLLALGARLAAAPRAALRAAPGGAAAGGPRGPGRERIAALELAVREMEAELPTLRSFILPGGHLTAAWAHVARAVCRRAERGVQRITMEGIEGEAPDPDLGAGLAYLNRLSTYLFSFARLCNASHGIPDEPWKEGP
jgi:cob(I)alamin adenosyltransferase